MRYCSLATAFAAALCLTSAESRAWNETAYPDLKGQWRVVGDPMQFDPSKPRGPAQQAPLTSEYQAVFEANLKDQLEGGQGDGGDGIGGDGRRPCCWAVGNDLQVAWSAQGGDGSLGHVRG